ncbi:MAG: glycerol-3-phosphate 1-O-acyltransferase PlsY [Candidatus Margulisiibacteriota bacterium]
MSILKLPVLILIAYLLGSLPFGYLFVKYFKKTDVRANGTGNIGATNAMLVGGKILGIITLMLDVAKGSAAVILAKVYGGGDWTIILCALAVVVGHDFSVFLNFKGGKGISTSGGAMLIIDPALTIICLLLYLLFLLSTRYVIMSTLMVMALLPLMLWLVSYGFNYILFGILLAALAWYVHRADVRRFFAGEETRLDEAWSKYSK